MIKSFNHINMTTRAKGNSGCPVCLREKIDARMEKRRTADTEKD